MPDPVVVTLDLDRISGVRCEDSKLKIELRPRRRNANHRPIIIEVHHDETSDPVTIEAQHGLSDNPWKELA